MKKLAYLFAGIIMVTAGVTEMMGVWHIAQSAEICFKFGACASILGLGTAFATLT